MSFWYFPALNVICAVAVLNRMSKMVNWHFRYNSSLRTIFSINYYYLQTFSKSIRETLVNVFWFYWGVCHFNFKSFCEWHNFHQNYWRKCLSWIDVLLITLHSETYIFNLSITWSGNVKVLNTMQCFACPKLGFQNLGMENK